MNKIEKMYYDEAVIYFTEKNVEYNKIVGVYKPDFIIMEKFIVEIDGHEYHKTKEQRKEDYSRERYFQKNGYLVIRFMGTEVFLDADDCVLQTAIIIQNCYSKYKVTNE